MATPAANDGNSVRLSRTPTVYDDDHPGGPARSATGKDGGSEKVEVDSQKGDPFLVRFSENDPENPQNWSRIKRWYLTLASGILVLNAAFASAAPSNILPQMMEEFHFGAEVASLVVSIFIVGYCVGPLLWGPLSEQIGRRPVFIISFLFYTGFQVGCALSKNTASILIFRFLGGTFAAAPLTNSGGVVSDIWDAKTRGKGMTIFAVAPFAGPALGPTVAGWIAVSGTSWRWLFWVLTIFAGVCFVWAVVGVPETYPPVLLSNKAARLRKETGDDRYYSPLEAQKMPFGKRAQKILGTPFKVLFQEPVLIALTVYMSFLYGCLYLLFEAYPIVFSQDHGLNPGVSGLMFLPISLGGALGCVVYLVYYNPRYNKYVDEYAPNLVPPEFRLEVTLLAGPLFAVSFFWFGWTSYSFISFWSPMMAGGLMGFSILLIFLSLVNYIVDVYLFVAASALAANTVVRSIFGAVFPLFARQMFEALNPRWASTLLGAFAALMVPIPFVLRIYGPALRAKSKFAPDLTVSVAPRKVEGAAA
ncbi:major facilitator superfamily domain-containing protein [Amylostereum chailletii]|nr:major facilitator superfamily domain-containing protein [Amylostereum chailletii]